MWDSQTWTSKTTTIECEGDVEECKRALKDFKRGDDSKAEFTPADYKSLEHDFEDVVKQRDKTIKQLMDATVVIEQLRADLGQMDASFKNLQSRFREQERNIERLSTENNLMKSLLSPWDKQ